MKVALVKTILLLLTINYPPRCTYGQHPFIRHDLNRIVLPADSSKWITLAEKIKASKADNRIPLNILHIGDSHIQGDYFTGQVRKNLFQYLKVENKSRGIIFPYYLAGTNGPDELFSSSTGKINKYNVRKNPAMFFPLTGYCVSFADSFTSINIKDTSKHIFNKAVVFHGPLKKEQLTLNNKSSKRLSVLTDSLYVSEFNFDELQKDVNLEMNNVSEIKKITIYGLTLTNDINNIVYNSVGINGATYGTFLQFKAYTEFLELINPDCIIFSYGTNEAMNKNIDTAVLKIQIHMAIQTVRKALPGIPIILTTPGDFLINKKNNPRAELVSSIVKQMAIDENCAFWDFYQVMGGKNSVYEWYRHQLMFKDWIHLSKKGYRLQGDLFFAALLKLCETKKDYD